MATTGPVAPGGYTTYTKDAAGAPPKAHGKSEMGQLDFLNLLTTQLKNQDPMNPQSDTDFASQMAQYSSLQQMQKLNDSMNKQTALTQMSSAASMIGQNVTTNQADESGQEISGIVSAVAMNPEGNVTLTIGKASVPITKITGISKQGPTLPADAAAPIVPAAPIAKEPIAQAPKALAA